MPLLSRRPPTPSLIVLFAGVAAGAPLAAQTGPDLVATRVTAPTAATVGDTVELSIVVANAGTKDVAANWNLQVFLGSTTRASAAGPLVSTAPWPRILKAAGGDSIRLRVVFPANTAPGSYYLTAMVDAGRVVTELNETNNLRVTTVRVAVTSRWDVTVGAVTLPDSLIKGSTLALSLPLRNLGTKPLPSGWLGRVYLSTDASFGSDDTYLGDFTVTQQVSAGATVTVPVSYASKAGNGTYRLIVIADANNELGESAEGNNIVASDRAVTIWERYVDFAGELSGIPATAYSTGAAGEAFPVTVTVRNLGTVEVPGGWDVRLFLSPDNNIWGSLENPQDRQLSQYVETRAIPAGGSIAKSVTIALPAGLSQTQWYVGLKLDYDNKVTEGGPSAGLSDAPGWRGGGNNERAVPFQVTGLPNLQVTSALAETPLRPGGQGSVSLTIANAGPGAAPAGWRGTFCLNGPNAPWMPPSYPRPRECSPTVDVQGTFLAVSRIAAGTSSTQTVEFLLPEWFWPGPYSLRAMLDAGNVVPETSELDNLSTVGGFAIQTLFDLEPTAITWDPALPAGSTSADLVVTVRHNGPVVVPPGILKIPDVLPGWNVRVKLSPTPADKNTWRDATVYAGATEPNIVPVGRLVSHHVSIGGFRAGDFVILVLDPENWIPEENEDNNTLISATPILPTERSNMLVTSAQPETVLEPGRTGTVSVAIANSGTGAAPAGWRAAACLTPVTASSGGSSAGCDPAAAPLGTAGIGASLAPGAATTLRIDLSLPTQLWPGQYRLTSLLDVGNVVPETIETDNTASHDGFNIQSRFDFEPTGITWDPALPATSTSAALVVMVRSNGLTVPSTVGWRIGVKLSPTPADKSTWRDGGPGLSVELKTIIGETPLKVPAGYLRPGDFVIVLIDQDNSIPESSENNNTLVSATPILPPGS